MQLLEVCIVVLRLDNYCFAHRKEEETIISDDGEKEGNKLLKKEILSDKIYFCQKFTKI
jgi:hypothetical protein